MNAIDIISKKRDGLELSKEEIKFFIDNYVAGLIPDYQASAWCMAVLLNGLTQAETALLTDTMINSGDTVTLEDIPGIKVDKHSTGGVGDTTTLILAPLAASLGIPVAKMSGRGLGHTGGTLDKLESIPGFQVNLSKEQFIQQIKSIGVAVMGQTANLVPADKKLYAIRDVTATVESIPLIASSVMSKKIAAGANAIVLDVKVGKGAFMKTLQDGLSLAKAMVDIGTRLGRETFALLTQMEQPLGRAVGNAIEVREAIEVLSNRGPEDLKQLCLELGARMLILAGKASSRDEAVLMLLEKIKSGEALHTFAKLIKAQGGDERVVYVPEQVLPLAKQAFEFKAKTQGTVIGLDAMLIGKAALALGAGRLTKDSVIDLSAGIYLEKKLGEQVVPGDVIAKLHYNQLDEKVLENVVKVLEQAVCVGNERHSLPPLLFGEVKADETIIYHEI